MWREWDASCFFPSCLLFRWVFRFVVLNDELLHLISQYKWQLWSSFLDITIIPWHRHFFLGFALCLFSFPAFKSIIVLNYCRKSKTLLPPAGEKTTVLEDSADVTMALQDLTHRLIGENNGVYFNICSMSMWYFGGYIRALLKRWNVESNLLCTHMVNCLLDKEIKLTLIN